MFGLFRRRPKQRSGEEYLAEFYRLLSDVEDQFSIGDSHYEQLVYSMARIEKELNHNGGCNWQEADYIDYLDFIREQLEMEATFTSEQLAKIRWSIDEIIACGRELEEDGESARAATEAVDYLVARAVDWCHLHPWSKERI